MSATMQLPLHGPSYRHLSVPHAVPCLTVLIVFVALDTFAVAALFVSRFTSVKRTFASDWLVLSSLIIYYGYAVCNGLSLYMGGTGWHITELGMSELLTAGKITLAMEFLYASGIGLCKVSILLLLCQIFSTRKFKMYAYMVMGLAIACAIMTVLIGFLICRPINYNWNKSINGKCGDQNSAYSAVAGTEIIIDAMICTLPLPMVWRLKTSISTKVSLSVLFCLGLLTIITTGVRLQAVLSIDFADFSFTSTNVFVWTTVEWGVAILVSCGPGCKPMLERILPRRVLTRRTVTRPSKAPPGSDRSGHKATFGSIDRETKGSRRGFMPALSSQRTSHAEYEPFDDDEIALQPLHHRYESKITARHSPVSGVGYPSDSPHNHAVELHAPHQSPGKILATTELTFHSEAHDGIKNRDLGSARGLNLA